MATDGRHDFDFLHGRWSVRHRRLTQRGSGSDDWREFTGSAETRPLLAGLCNVEEHRIPEADLSGMALRTVNPAVQQWSIYWVSGSRGVLEPPVTGRFDADIGRFEGNDSEKGRAIRVRFLWDRTDHDKPRWEQSFSYDEGRSWELNWIMRFDRV